jgi:hypothetical protein
VEAIVWLDRTGVPWRGLPGQFGPWATVASRFYRWRRQGVWDRVLQALQGDADAQGELDWLLHFVDGSVCEPTSTLPGPGGGKPMVILATAGQRNEAPMLRALMEAGAVRRPRGRPRIRPAAVAGD